MKLVSVVMPAYNAGLYIRESIESILKQTYQTWELVIVNDGSKDNTLEIIQEYVASYPDRIRLINKEKNEGTVAGLNSAIEAANGEYICWLSADDLYQEGMIESSIRFLEESGRTQEDASPISPKYEVVFSNDLPIDRNSNLFPKPAGTRGLNDLNENVEREPYYTLLQRCCINGCTVMMKKACYYAVGGFDSSYRYAHDYDFWLRLAAMYPIGHFNMVNVLGRTYEEQISRQGHNEVDAIKVIFNFMKEEELFNRLCRRAQIPTGIDGIAEVIEKQLILYKHKEREFNELYEHSIELLSKYEQGNPRVQNLLKKFEVIVQNPIIPNPEFFNDASDYNYLQLLSEDLGLDGFFINKQGVRFDRFEGFRIDRLNKGFMRTNTIITCRISKEHLRKILKDGNQIRYYVVKKEQEYYHVGFSYYMYLDEAFRYMITTDHLEITDIDIWNRMIEIVISKYSL